VIALVYLDRVVETHPELVVSYRTVHRLLLIAIMLAAKFLDDKGGDNIHFAECCDLSLKDVNDMEASFLDMLRWRLFVRRSEYDWYCQLVAMAC